MKTIVPIVLRKLCFGWLEVRVFGDTRNLVMRRSSPVGQMEAELTCSKYPIQVVCTYGRGIFWSQDWFVLWIQEPQGNWSTFDITIHNPIDSNIQQNSKWPFPPFDLTNDWHLEPAMIPSCVTDTAGQWDPGKVPLLVSDTYGSVNWDSWRDSEVLILFDSMIRWDIT